MTPAVQLLSLGMVDPVILSSQPFNVGQWSNVDLGLTSNRSNRKGTLILGKDLE